MSEITISKLAKLTGLNSSAIRFYEQEGLIQSIGREGLQRVFHKRVIEELLLITWAKETGFSLSEIKKMFKDKSNPIDKEKLKEKVAEMDKLIAKYTELKRSFTHISHCSYENSLYCPKFQKILLSGREHWKK